MTQTILLECLCGSLGRCWVLACCQARQRAGKVSHSRGIMVRCMSHTTGHRSSYIIQGDPVVCIATVLWFSIISEHVQDGQFPPQSMRDKGGKGRLTFQFCGAFLVWGGYHAASSTERSASQEIDQEHKQPARTCPSQYGLGMCSFATTMHKFMLVRYKSNWSTN